MVLLKITSSLALIWSLWNCLTFTILWISLRFSSSVRVSFWMLRWTHRESVSYFTTCSTYKAPHVVIFRGCNSKQFSDYRFICSFALLPVPTSKNFGCVLAFSHWTLRACQQDLCKISNFYLENQCHPLDISSFFVKDPFVIIDDKQQTWRRDELSSNFFAGWS